MKKAIVCLIAVTLFAGVWFNPARAQAPAQCDVEYTVQAGDWLSKIADKYLGDVLAFDQIVQANNLQGDDAYTDIANPDLIEPGWTLCIPAAEGQSAAAPELTGTVWQWQQTRMSNDDSFTPDTPANYTVQFQPDGIVAIQADCNQINGNYTLDGSSITITLGPSTMAACPEGSLGDAFAAQLGQAAIFFFQDGDLLIDLMFDSGTMRFSAQSGAAGAPQGVANIVWQWSDLVEQAPASQSVVPNPENYTLTFKDDGTVTIQADCNSVQGTYQWDAQGLKIELGPSTMAFCGEQSLDEQFLSLVPNMVAGGLDGDRFFLESAGGAERMGFNSGGGN